jgi:hypothetical protein
MISLLWVTDGFPDEHRYPDSIRSVPGWQPVVIGNLLTSLGEFRLRGNEAQATSGDSAGQEATFQPQPPETVPGTANCASTG